MILERVPFEAAPLARPTDRPKMSCRRMRDEDIEPAIALLSAGFPERTPAYWERALLRLRVRHVPDGYPRYGYVMSDGDDIVGIILLVFSQTDAGAIRGNVSSWCVDPAYRGFSHLLLAIPLKLEGVTLFNISPAPTTFATIGAQGFARYVDGTFHALAALAPAVSGARIRRVTGNDASATRLLRDHAGWDCLCFEVTHEGQTHPFVFTPCRFLGRRLPAAQLTYCEDVADFVRFAGPLGRRLLRLGLPVVLVDANGPVRGLWGHYRDGRSPRYYRGGTAPRLGDLSYTEFAIFGP